MATIKPIWEDTVYSEQLVDSFFEYHIDDTDDTILYAGKAYKYPNEDKGEVYINDITENFLTNHISFNLGFGEMTDFCKNFKFVTSSGNTNTYTFYNDWSYENTNAMTYKHQILNDPITRKVDSRQFFFLNVLNLGSSAIVTVQVNGSPEPAIALSGNKATSLVRKYSAPCGSKIEIGTSDNTESLEYTFDSKDYCLYYVNAFGGWDSLLIDGNTKRTDQIVSSEQYIKKAKANSLEFGKTKYLNTIVPSWTLYTGHMSDEESSKMHHLLESTEVYLHNLIDDTITPVLITDTSCEYKTYSNNGKKLPSYIINVEASQEKYRK